MGRPEADLPGGRWEQPVGAEAAGTAAEPAEAAAAASGWAVHISFPPPCLPSPPAVPSAWRPRPRLASPPGCPRPLPYPPIHVPTRGAPGLLLPGGWALGRAAGRGPGHRGHSRPGAASAPAAAALAPGRAAAPAAASLLGHRHRGASRDSRALLPPSRRCGRCRPELRGAARASAAVARAATADPGVLHGGTQLRGAIAQQLPAGEERVPVLGWLLGDTLWNHRINNLEKAYDTPGKPLCAALCGMCPLKFSWIYPGLPRGPVRVQRAQVDLGEGKICFCCEEFQPAKCTDKENALKLFPVQPCSAVHLLLKKVLFALCALNALTTTVCLVAAALRYLQIFAARRSCSDESQISAEEVDEHRRIPDPDDFVPPVPPPSYFATYYSCTPRMNRRYRSMGGPNIIPLPHIYGARIKGVEVFCPLDPPPPYEAVVNQTDRPQASLFRMSGGSEAAASPMEQDCMTVTQDGDIPNAPGGESASTSTADSHQLQAMESGGPLQPLRTRSKSDPLLHHSVERDTKVLVAKILEQSSGNVNPDIHELVESIKSVLKCDEEHMEAAIASASVLEQIMAPGQIGPIRARRLPLRRLPGLLHLQSCGDLSTFVSAGRLRGERRPRRAAERPHSHIGVVRETVL
ncbi:endosomal transmembrane epsin interactor 1 isoform X2 [Desmodus rotundus]|uniref:endosomal transmembrane epsin interactor 1 isoform X2 n=1 Tax=Desmodus rotundus TaxID=9430 RepID=UPI00238185AA|nr:endosomal transmembrane epsin interactor 1 isoform X2 [Desmodus rotundus]